MSKIHQIISRLLAKAESTDSPAERETFVAKALELMERHQIEAFELGEDDPIGFTQGVLGEAGQGEYKAAVQTALARYYGAEPVKTYAGRYGKGKFYVALFGPESSRLTTELMLPFVWKQVCEQGNLWAKQWQTSKHKGIREVAKALCARIRRETSTATHDEHTAFGLVVVDATKSFMDKYYKGQELVDIKGRGVRLFNSAKEMAETIAIAKQVGTDVKGLLS